MNTVKTFQKWLLIMLLAVGITSCITDDNYYGDNYYGDTIYGVTWVGNLGFAFNGENVESGITFKQSGYAYDEQYFYDGTRATTLDLRWWTDSNSLYLDYGSNYPMLTIRNLYVGSTTMSGDLYVDNTYDGPVTLRAASY